MHVLDGPRDTERERAMYVRRYQRLARYLVEAIKLSEMGIMCSLWHRKSTFISNIATTMATISKRWPCVMSTFSLLPARPKYIHPMYSRVIAIGFCVVGCQRQLCLAISSNIIFLKFSTLRLTCRLQCRNANE